MNNKWKAIWNGRKPAADALAGSWQEVFLELKRLNGYDVMGDGISLKAFLEEDAQTREFQCFRGRLWYRCKYLSHGTRRDDRRRHRLCGKPH